MSNADYQLGVDSTPQSRVPKGTVEKLRLEKSRIYPGTLHDYWVYVPDQYRDYEPVCVMFFQDGEAYVDEEGSVRVPTVFDNLIHKQVMPTCVGVFINPASIDELFDHRAAEYCPLTDRYARFLVEEISQEVGREVNLTSDREGRAICGMSDGGLCSFNAAWLRPDLFSKAVSHVGSYTRIRGGSEYPYLIRQTRGDPKPIRIFLQDGSNDINIAEGNWTLANLSMASALMYARYDYRFEFGSGGHDLVHAGAIFPDSLRWLWRDFLGVRNDTTRPTLETVVGEWRMVVNYFGEERSSVLSIERRAAGLSGSLHDDMDGDVEITAIDFDDEILRYTHASPASQKNWGKSSHQTMTAWLKVSDESLEGVLSMNEDIPMDMPLQGRRIDTSN